MICNSTELISEKFCPHLVFKTSVANMKHAIDILVEKLKKSVCFLIQMNNLVFLIRCDLFLTGLFRIRISLDALYQTI